MFQDAGSTCSPLLDQHPPSREGAVPEHVFAENFRPPADEPKLPKVGEHLDNTSQLVFCLGLLKDVHSPDEILDPAAQRWLQDIKDDTNEQERLHGIATGLIKEFKRDKLKDPQAVAEVVRLAPVLDKAAFQDLLEELCTGIDCLDSLDLYQIEGLAQLIQGADPGHLSADDLAKILKLLGAHLMDTQQQPSQHMQLAMAVSHVLDAITDAKITGLDRNKLLESLSLYLDGLKKSSNPFLVYQAAYAYQALLCVPDETAWQAVMPSTTKDLDLTEFIARLESIQEGVFKAVGAVKSTNHGFLNCLEEGLAFEQKRDWYSALRGADVLIRHGKLVAFKNLVCEAPCRYDPAFQWGVCQRLGDMAANPTWDAVTRQSAIQFLGEIYKNDAMWGQQLSIRHWIITILTQLSEGSSEVHATAAGTLLRNLETIEDAEKQVLYQAWKEKGPTSYTPKVVIPEPTTPSLLDRVQERADIEGKLCFLKKQRIGERGNLIYIALQAKSNLQATDGRQFSLKYKVMEFLGGDQKVFLLLGDSGAGKSTFMHELEYELWRAFNNKTDRIPLFIDLPTIDKPEHDMIAKQLRKADFTESQIQEMKHHRRFILFCDGYDESQQTQNLYTSNRLNQPGEWNAQMVISCRSEYLGPNYCDQFRQGELLPQEAVILPFSLNQVQDFIRQYVFVHQPQWRVEDYMHALDHVPGLMDLVKNPLLMTFSLDVLPQMVEPGQPLSSTRVSRVVLYDHFVEQLIERGKKRLGGKTLVPQAKAAFEKLSAEGFKLKAIEYIKKFATAIYKEQDGRPVVEYSKLTHEGSWKDSFFGSLENQLLHEACPLTRNGNQHWFIHRSLLEYALVRALYDPQEWLRRTTSKLDSTRGSGVSSTMDSDAHRGEEKATTVIEQEPDPSSPLSWKSFMNDYSFLQLLADRVQQEPMFKEQLLTYIEYSKKDKKWGAIAANAITILVRAGVQFIGTDLRGIQIPGADLSCGVFESVQFQGADLMKVNLRGAWLRNSDLSKADMTGVQFGDLPSFDQGSVVVSCSYSPDGKELALGLVSGNINVYSTLNWQKIQTLRGHDQAVRVVYSPKGDQILSGSWDKTVRIWDAQSGNCRHVLVGHSDHIQSVAYSPRGDQVASSGDDMTIRLWNPVNGHCRQILSNHDKGVFCVAYSPKGNLLASGSDDCTARLWNTETGECSHIFIGHKAVVWAIAFSPGGDHVASASIDRTIRLWNVKTAECAKIFSEDGCPFLGVAYSPKGDRIVSGGDEYVQIWDVESGARLESFTGHSKQVFSVAFSPDGNQVASTSADNTVHLWDVSIKASRTNSNSHSAGTIGLECSPKGDLIASSSFDSTIRLWDAETGVCHRTMSHGDAVHSVAFSPQGDQIVSSSNDHTVQLWNVASGTCQHILTGHTERVNGVAYSSQGDRVASASGDNTVRIWDAKNGSCLGTLSGHTAEVSSVAYSPNGSQIATGGKDCTVRLWDARTTICRGVLRGHFLFIMAIAFSPQGEEVASAGADMGVLVWNVTTGRCRLRLSGHLSGIMSVAYSRKGDLLASGGLDTTVRLWDVASGQCRGVIEGPRPISSVTWNTTGDADYVISGCAFGSVLKWQVTKEGESCHTSLGWAATTGMLIVEGISINGVQGLSPLNHQLLKQRGVVGQLGQLSRRVRVKIVEMMMGLMHRTNPTIALRTVKAVGVLLALLALYVLVKVLLMFWGVIGWAIALLFRGSS
ncbi:hypothetical protein BGX34_008331 [Mortierella sp. NVP85]|nr:hypothetical protein BGX34_008331 [Mortierella sp. NVP85]